MQSNSTPVLSRTQQVRRADIILAAVAVINHNGYAAASVERVAKQAGTSKGTILYHFESRRNLEEAIVSAVYEAGAAYMIPKITAASNYRGQLTAYISSNLQYIAENKEQIAAVQQIDKNSPLIERNEAAISSLERLLEKGMRADELTGFDPHTLAVAIRLVIDSSSFYILGHPSLDVGRYIQEIVRIFDKAVS